MTLPTFLIVGAQKAGTTSLWAYLDAHPQVYVSTPKELDFFVAELAWERGLAWYENQFVAADGALAVGEASPSYTMHPYFAGVPERIASVVPDIRLVYCVRDPVERLRSSYLHALTSGAENRPIERALREDDRYLAISRYGEQLDRLLSVFDRSQVLVVVAEELRDRRREVFGDVCRFIGVDDAIEPPNLEVEYHSTGEKRVPRPWARRVGAVLHRAGLGPRPGSKPKPPPSWATAPLDPNAGRLDPALRAWAVERLRSDLHRFCELFEREGFDGWGHVT